MTILGNNAAKLNEIIFADRNKNYGAYAIRASYDSSLLKSLGYLIGLLIVLGTSVFVMNRNNRPEEQQHMLMIDSVDSLYTIEYKMEEPKQPEKQEPKTVDNSSAAPSGGVPNIVDHTVITTTVNLTNVITGQGTATATGTSTGTTVSTSTLVIQSDGKKELDTKDYVIVEEMPEFNSNPNGVLQYVGSHIVYPDLAREVGREGTVYVSFIVNQLGEVEGAKVLKGIGFGCEEEVLRVINKMPTWKKPGKNNGIAVRVRYSIPVNFKLK